MKSSLRPAMSQSSPRSKGVTVPSVVLADHDESPLGSQDVQRLGAVDAEPVVPPGLDQRLPQVEAIARGHIDLVGELAREADAEEAGGRAGDGHPR